MHSIRRLRVRNAICTALLLTQLTACMTWRPVGGTLDQQVGSERIREARVVLRNGNELMQRAVLWHFENG